MATVTMEESEYQMLKSAVVAADERTAAVKAELEAERARSFDERLDQLTRAFGAAKVIIDYAVGNLDPEFSRGWPHEALDTLASCVATLPSAVARDGERALIWRQFHTRIIDFDMRWKRAELSYPVPSGGVLGEIAKLAEQQPVAPPIEPVEQPRPKTRTFGDSDQSIVYVVFSVLIAVLLIGGAIGVYLLGT